MTPTVRPGRRKRGRAVATALASGAALAAPRVAIAQAVRVTTVSAATGADVPNALLTAVDARDTTVAVTTTALQGARLVPVPQAGTYRFVVRRIGQRPFTSAPVVVGARDTLALTLRLPTAPVVLSGVRVAGLASCAAGRRHDAPDVTALWDEIRTAVRLVTLQDGDSAPPAEVRRFVTRLDADGRTVLAHTVLPAEYGRVHLFGTAPPESLATRGYIRRTDTTTTYTVPDGPTLLSDAFARDHCFDLVAGADSAPGLVGLAFTPTPGRRVPEVAGVLWADTATTALRALAFRYVAPGRPPGPAPAERGVGWGSGEVRFDTLPDGTWALVAWRLRTPSVEIGAVTTAGPAPGPERAATGSTTAGSTTAGSTTAGTAAAGGLAGDPPGVDPPWQVDTRAGLARLAPRVRNGAVVVHVRDARGRPVAGAAVALAQQADPAGAAWVVSDGGTRVQLAHAAAGALATTTADGAATVPALPPGRYLVRVALRSPAGDVEPPVVAVAVTPGSRAVLTVAAPALAALAARCPARARADTSTTRLIYGTVVDERAWAAWAPRAAWGVAGRATPGADTAAPPVRGARVRASWTDGAAGRATTSEPATTDGDGHFVICGVPRTAAAVVTAEATDEPSASWAVGLSPERWNAASTRVALRRPATRGRRDLPTDPFTLVGDEAVHDSVTGALGAVHGAVYDSLTRRSLAGAIVQIVRAGDLLGGHAVAADSAGAFRIDSLAPGRYLVGFFHPRLDLLRIEVPPRLVELGPGGDVVRIDLGVPALARVRPVVCGSPQAPTDSSGLLAGRVRDASDDAPVANATVVLTWSERSLGADGVRTEHRRVPVPTGPGGTYVACGVPAGVELAVSVAAPGRAGGPVALELPPRGFVVRDLALGDTVSVVAAPAPPGRAAARPGAGDTTAAPLARGTARLTGTVRDSAGRPVRGARASVRGTAAATTVGADGAFALGGLPAGTRTLEVRAIGFAVRRVPVDLAAGRTGTLDVRMERTVATLNPVKVVGTPASSLLQVRDFLDRRRHSAFGRFLTAADLERRNPAQVTDALRGMPGLQVAPNGRLGNTILGRGKFGDNCPAAVVLDGVALPPGGDIDQFVSPGQVAGIEVYSDPAFAPPEYGGARMNGCSVVLVWTR